MSMSKANSEFFMAHTHQDPQSSINKYGRSNIQFSMLHCPELWRFRHQKLPLQEHNEIQICLASIIMECYNPIVDGPN